MEGRSVRHNFERDPPKDHPCQVWFNLVQGFQRRRFKCESLQRTTDGRTPSDGKSTHGLWPCELKTCKKHIILEPSQKCTNSLLNSHHGKKLSLNHLNKKGSETYLQTIVLYTCT